MEERKGQNVRMEDVARAAGISRQALYLHFPSRTDLLVATVRYVDQALELEKRLAACYKATNCLESLDATVDFWGNYIPEIYPLAKALQNVRDTDEAAAAAWDDRMAALYGGCKYVAEGLAQEGRLLPEWTIEGAADMFWSLLDIAVWEDLCMERGWPVSKYVSHMQSTVRRALTGVK